MTESAGVPIEKIIEAPRLASIGTTVDDMKKAIETNSNVLCTVNMPDGLCLVKRKDGCMSQFIIFYRFMSLY